MLEQQCLYLDIDDLDNCSWHLLGLDSTGGLIAYLRAIEPGKKYSEPAIGRVVVRMQNRSAGIGKALVLEGIRCTQQQFGSQPIRISAQQVSAGFYRQIGFIETQKRYLEDGIPHVEMYWKSPVY